MPFPLIAVAYAAPVVLAGGVVVYGYFRTRQATPEPPVSAEKAVSPQEPKPTKPSSWYSPLKWWGSTRTVDLLDQKRRKLWRWRWPLYILASLGAFFLLVGFARVAWNKLYPLYSGL